MHAFHQPGYWPLPGAAEPDYRALEQCFDPDLLVEPFHDKRYRHLNHGSWASFPVDWVDHQDPVKKAPWLLLMLLITGTALIAWMLEIYLREDSTPLRRVPTIKVTLDSHTDSPAQPLDEKNIAPPLPQQIESQETGSDYAEKETANQNSQPDRAVAETEQSPPPTQVSPQEVIEKQSFDLYSSITTIGKSWAEKKEDYQPPDDSLSADGVVFDSTLREKLDSEFVQNLNRWRPPVEKAVVMSAETTFFVLGDKCYSVTENTPGFAPIIGRIDCDKVFYNGHITRDDIRRQNTDQ